MRYKGKIVKTHRLSYKLSNPEKDINGLVVRHTCNNPPCCNPDHLIAGTQQENMDDRDLIGHSIKKLSHEQIKYVIDKYRSIKITQRALAKEMGVSHQMMSMILNGKRRTKGKVN